MLLELKGFFMSFKTWSKGVGTLKQIHDEGKAKAEPTVAKPADQPDRAPDKMPEKSPVQGPPLRKS